MPTKVLLVLVFVLMHTHAVYAYARGDHPIATNIAQNLFVCREESVASRLYAFGLDNDTRITRSRAAVEGCGILMIWVPADFLYICQKEVLRKCGAMPLPSPLGWIFGIIFPISGLP